MKKYFIDYSIKAKTDIEKIKKSGNKNAFDKVVTLIEELENHPRTGTGHPEQLKGYPDIERWSRRISKEHRLVYDIEDDIVVVILVSAYGHYDDR